MNPKQPTFLNVQLQGLNTFQSELSAVPEGSLITADNVNLDKEGILETRRGIGTKLEVPALTDVHPAYIRSLHPFKDNVIIYTEYMNRTTNTTEGNNLLIAPSDLSSVSTKLSDYAPADVSDFKLRSATFRSNLYLTSPTGVKKLEDPNRRILSTGVPKAFALDYGISGVLDPETVKVIAGTEDVPTSATSTRDLDTFETILARDQDVEIKATNDSVELIFPQSIILEGDAELNEISIPPDSGLGGEPGVYPVYGQSGNSITIPNTATDFPQIDYEIPRGDLTLIADPDDDSNIIIVLPETTEAPPKLLENRQMLIEAGTLDNEQDLEIPILRVDGQQITCLLYTSPSPRDRQKSRMPSSA